MVFVIIVIVFLVLFIITKFVEGYVDMDNKLKANQLMRDEINRRNSK